MTLFQNKFLVDGELQEHKELWCINCNAYYYGYLLSYITPGTHLILSLLCLIIVFLLLHLRWIRPLLLTLQKLLLYYGYY